MIHIGITFIFRLFLWSHECGCTVLAVEILPNRLTPKSKFRVQVRCDSPKFSEDSRSFGVNSSFRPETFRVYVDSPIRTGIDSSRVLIQMVLQKRLRQLNNHVQRCFLQELLIKRSKNWRRSRSGKLFALMRS